MRRLLGLIVVLLAVGLPVPTSSALPESPQRPKAPRLVIDEIGVDAGMIAVGLTRNGALAVGGSVTNVYRWKQGVRPGALGSAVLAGHTWSKGDGVFDRLGELRKGDEIRVGEHRFTVTRRQVVKKMKPKDVARLYSDRGPARLVLITCGDRNNATGVYRTRIIVRAALQPKK